MEIYDLSNVDFNEKAPSAVALGFFDGLHLGHQALIKKMLEIAETNNFESCILTFRQHPLTLIFPTYTPKLISSNDEKIEVLEELSVDKLVFIEFTEEIMNYDPEEFVKEVLIKRLNVKSVIVGFNYNFGHKGQGTAELLKELGKKYGYEVTIVSPIEINGQIVSSTLIRNLIVNGKVDQVEKYLGRKFSVNGEVVRGKGLGRQFAIPTANMIVDEDHILPDAGVYYTSVNVRGISYHGLTNVGYNPTFENHPFSIETYIYDFDDDIYGEYVDLTFIRKIRKEKKFNSLDELIKQIQHDIQQIREKYIN
ncbi:MAG: bifunctional riboflavin kinase/FAD synthetase [Eubacteriaceae bacterium]|nr:bifunctional riboflavin kinase/FAD synthetase [Eubacteriaceae bacterium]